MGTKSNPGAYDCYAHAHPDEPMFVLLGRDRIGGSLTRLWAAAREQMGEDPPTVAEAHDCAALMDAWCRDAGKSPAEILDLLPFELLAAAIQRRSGVVMMQVQETPAGDKMQLQRVPIATTLVLTGEQIEELFQFVGGDVEAEVSLGYGDGHSGQGLYAWITEYPDEGALALFEPMEAQPQQPGLDLESDAPLKKTSEPTGNGEMCESCQ